ncbi:hypothetical protein O181_060786 [Austropuccinia psidii MF-1]|uniref:Uncharacterized protein n=1 Tax=Austropuccinia psidii MF-1 TaxID=1389203 RepID=A0A9Q3EET2_9BASI|nr:hypothetical protein [Austropuccinia psidii MF-1]
MDHSPFVIANVLNSHPHPSSLVQTISSNPLNQPILHQQPLMHPNHNLQQHQQQAIHHQQQQVLSISIQQKLPHQQPSQQSSHHQHQIIQAQSQSHQQSQPFQLKY